MRYDRGPYTGLVRRYKIKNNLLRPDGSVDLKITETNFIYLNDIFVTSLARDLKSNEEIIVGLCEKIILLKRRRGINDEK